MSATTFDRLEFVETLKEAGVPDKQAKAFSIAVKKLHTDADLTTKQDFTELRYELRYEMSDLRKDVDTLRKDMQQQIKTLELHLTVRLGTIVIAAAGALPILSKLLHWS